MRSGGVASDDRLSSKPVLSVGDGLKMVRVAAGPDAAQVVRLHPLRDRADPRLVGKSVRPRLLALHIDEPVSILEGPGPDPAVPKVWPDGRNWAVPINTFFESIDRSEFGKHASVESLLIVLHAKTTDEGLRFT